jgi:hypothetical protein
VLFSGYSSQWLILIILSKAHCPNTGQHHDFAHKLSSSACDGEEQHLTSYSHVLHLPIEGTDCVVVEEHFQLVSTTMHLLVHAFRQPRSHHGDKKHFTYCLLHECVACSGRIARGMICAGITGCQQTTNNHLPPWIDQSQYQIFAVTLLHQL